MADNGSIVQRQHHCAAPPVARATSPAISSRSVARATGSTRFALTVPTDQLFASRARAPSGEHEFDQLCAEPGIEHRLTLPKSPQTNGMAARFNGRISDVLRSNRFDSAPDLEQFLMRYLHLYNTQLPQSALGR